MVHGAYSQNFLRIIFIVTFSATKLFKKIWISRKLVTRFIRNIFSPKTLCFNLTKFVSYYFKNFGM